MLSSAHVFNFRLKTDQKASVYFFMHVLGYLVY